jgi:hypothetical protein
MTIHDRDDVPPVYDPEGWLERQLIAEFLHALGYDASTLDALPAPQRKHLLQDASVYAAGKLAEIGARAHYIAEIHRRE